MAKRSGPLTVIKSNAAIVADSTWYEMTPFVMRHNANCVKLYFTLTTGGAGTISFKADLSPDAESKYYPLVYEAETPTVWGPVTAASAANYCVQLNGIDAPPGDFVKLYYQVSDVTASPELAVTVLPYESSNGTSVSAGDIAVSVGDVAVDTAALEVLLADFPNVVGVDGTPGPTSAISIGGTEAGGGFKEALVDSDGHLQIDVLSVAGAGGTTEFAEDTQHTTGDLGPQVLTVRSDAAAALAGTDNDYQPLITDANGRLHTKEENSATINSSLSTIAGDTTSVDGKTPALGTAAMAGSVPVTLATDDTHYGAVGAAADVDGNIHGQLRYIGESVGSATEYAEDTQHTTGDLGPQVLTVRKDTAAALAGTDNDYQPILTDNAGHVWTRDRNSTDILSTLSTINSDTGTISGKIPTQGSALMAGSQPVTLATDDTHFGAVGAAADADGVVHGQLRYIGESVDGLEGTLGDVSNNTVATKTAVELIDDAIYADDADWVDGTSKHMLAGGLYQSSQQTITDGDVGPFQVDSNGNQIVTPASGAQFVIDDGGSSITVDGTITEANSTTIAVASAAIASSVQIIDDAIYADDADWSDGSSKHALVGGLYQSTQQTVTDGDVAPFQSDVNGNILVAPKPDTTFPTSLARKEIAIAFVGAAITTPGTAVPLSSSSIAVSYFILEAKKATGVNTGNIYLGTSAVDKTTSQQLILEPGDKYEFNAPDGVVVDLDAIYIDSDNAADAVQILYIQE